MAFKLQNQSFSFLRGPDRIVEEKLWGPYANLWGKTIPQNGIPHKMSSMLLYKRMDVVVATLLEVIGIVHLTRPLPYPLHAPENLLTWSPSDLADTPVHTGDDFFKHMLGIYGITQRSILNHSWLVVIDPDQMPQNRQHELIDTINASHSEVLIVTKSGAALSSKWTKLLGTKRITTFVTDSPSPLISPEIDELVTTRGISSLTFAGSGPRLFPSVIAGLDILLDLYDHQGFMSYDIRRQLAGNLVSLASAHVTFDIGWFAAPGTLRTTLSSYLNSIGVLTSDVSGSYDTTGGFATKPLLVPKN